MEQEGELKTNKRNEGEGEIGYLISGQLRCCCSLCGACCSDWTRTGALSLRLFSSISSLKLLALSSSLKSLSSPHLLEEISQSVILTKTGKE